MEQLKWTTTESGVMSHATIGLMCLYVAEKHEDWEAVVVFADAEKDEAVTVARGVRLKSAEEAREWAEVSAKRIALSVIIAFGGIGEFSKVSGHDR